MGNIVFVFNEQGYFYYFFCLTHSELRFSSFSILVFAQGKSNRVLALLIALSFYMQIIVSMSIFNSFGWTPLGYVLATEHPVVRLPVFLMGVFAGYFASGSIKEILMPSRVSLVSNFKMIQCLYSNYSIPCLAFGCNTCLGQTPLDRQRWRYCKPQQ